MEVTLVGASWDLVAGVGEKKQKKNSKPTQSTPTNLPQKEQILWARHKKGEGGGAALPHLAPPLRPPSPSPMPPGPLVLTYLELQTATGDFAR